MKENHSGIFRVSRLAVEDPESLDVGVFVIHNVISFRDFFVLAQLILGLPSIIARHLPKAFASYVNHLPVRLKTVIVNFSEHKIVFTRIC